MKMGSIDQSRTHTSGGNVVFNVNGCTQELLLQTLQLAFKQNGDRCLAQCWRVDKDKGLILFYYGDPKGSQKFPAPLSAEEVTPIVWKFLIGEEARTIELQHSDSPIDTDGSLGGGWRVYCEAWGHVAEEWGAIVAITPAVMWYGK